MRYCAPVMHSFYLVCVCFAAAVIETHMYFSNGFFFVYILRCIIAWQNLSFIVCWMLAAGKSSWPDLRDHISLKFVSKSNRFNVGGRGLRPISFVHLWCCGLKSSAKVVNLVARNKVNCASITVLRGQGCNFHTRCGIVKKTQIDLRKQ